MYMENGHGHRYEQRFGCGIDTGMDMDMNIRSDMSGNHDASYLHKIKSTYINVDFDQSKKPLTWTP